MDIEIATLHAQQSYGIVPKDATLLSALADISFTPEAIETISQIEENVTHHDVAAFVAAVPAFIPPEHPAKAPAERFFHFGLTSSDVVDTALCLAVQECSRHLLPPIRTLGSIFSDLVHELHDVPALGYTHGQLARLTTWGHRINAWWASVDSCYTQLDAAIEALRVGRLRGPLGNYSPYLPREVEQVALTTLRLRPAPDATQVISRELFSDLVYALARLLAVYNKIATDLRLLSSLDQVRSTPPDGYQGSSSMPHKVNPTSLERIAGFSRLLNGYSTAALDNVPLWMERDMSHSSVERVIIPDAFHLATGATDDLIGFLDDLLFLPASNAPSDTYVKLHDRILSGESRQIAHEALRGR